MRYTQHDKTIPSGLRYHGKTPQGPKPANCRPNTTTIDRRALLKASIAGMTTSFFIMPRHVVGGSGQVPPSEKVNLALVGAGGQGRTNVRALFDVPEAQFISVADPAESFNLDRFYYKGVAGRDPIKAEIEKHYAESTPNYRVATYVNFREMLDREKSIDAVLCATPDHLHAFVTSHALRAGKHVFCEKPLTHNIWEARQVAKIERETHLATQMGNIGHSTDDMRKTVEYLQAGAIGAVREVHAWVPAGRWNPALTGRPDPEAIPNGLNWDLWLGPRNTRPYSSAYAPVGWRDFWDFGGSNIGDFACHDLDAATWALDLKTPETIEAYPAGPHTEDIGPHGSLIRYTFAARGDQPPLKIHWYDGGLKPARPVELDANFELPRRGILFVGDKGVLFCGGAGGALRLFPQHRSQEFTPPAPTIKRSQGHHRDWVLACKGGEPASSNFEYGARLTELALLGVLALRSGRTIEWDGDAMQAKGFPEAEQWIKESIRPGWEMA